MRKFLLKVLRKSKILQSININVDLEVNHIVYKVPILGGIGFKNYLKISEPWMIYILKKLINELNFNGSFVDVGVNLGQTLIKVKSVSKEIHYIGFEPNPICIHYVFQLIAANGLQNVDLYPIAVGDKTSIMSLNFFSNSNIGSSATLIKNFRENETVCHEMNVPVFSSEHLMDFQDISIIKIDVEGAELDVLKGLLKQIKLYKPVIFIEILPNYGGSVNERVSRQREIKLILEHLDYEIFRILKDHNHFKGVKKILNFGEHSDLSLSDYLIIPSCESRRVTSTLSQ